MIIPRLNNLIGAAEHLIAAPYFLPKVHLAPFIADLRDDQIVQSCTYILSHQARYNPIDEDLVNGKESIAVHQVLGRKVRKGFLDIQAESDMSGKLVIPSPVQNTVHQVVHKGDYISSLIRNKSLPRFRKFSSYILGSIGDEHGHDQFFQRRLDIRIAEMLLAELPEIIQQAVFLYFGQELVICKLAVRQYDPDYFFKGTGAGATNGRKETRDDVLFIEVLDFKVIEALCPFLVGKELDVLFNDGFIFLIDTQIHQKQRGTVGKKALGIEQRVFQMVVPHIRLWKGSINEVVCGGVLPFQKELGGKLIVRL